MHDDVASRWFEIALHVASADVDAASGVLACAGVDGCEIVESVVGSESACCEIRVHVLETDADAARARAAELRARLGTLLATPATMSSAATAADFTRASSRPFFRPSAPLSDRPSGQPSNDAVRELDERVWRDDWKRHFARTRIGRRLEILPPWDAVSSIEAGVVSVVINPGMAFGTGQHETTAGCLELLEDLVRSGDRVLDLGCGSGILAIAAAKLGASYALAIDNDPEAVNAAHENIVLNAVSDERVEVWLGDGPPACAGADADANKNVNVDVDIDVGTGLSMAARRPFDLAVANILAEPLAQLAAALTSCVKDDGALVLSGIESQRRALVEVAYGQLGWRVSRTIERSGWVSLALAQQGAAGARGL